MNRPALVLSLVLALEGRLLAQAEPAPPPEPVPAPRPVVRPVPRVLVAANLRFALLLPETSDVAAALGWGFGLRFSASLLPMGPLRLGFVLDYAQDRFSRDIPNLPPTAADEPQILVHNTCAALLLVDVPTRFVRPYLSVGPGLSVARHQSPLPDPQQSLPDTEQVATLPLLRAAAGLGISPVRWFEFGVSGELTLTFSDQLGGVDARGEMPVLGTGRLFAPGFFSLATYVAYRFY